MSIKKNVFNSTEENILTTKSLGLGGWGSLVSGYDKGD